MLMRNIYLNHSSRQGVSAGSVEAVQHVQFADSLQCSSQYFKIVGIALHLKTRKNVPECAVWFLYICHSLKASSPLSIDFKSRTLAFCLSSVEF